MASKVRKLSKMSKPFDEGVEDTPRVAYTSGWNAGLKKTKEALPIKTKSGQIVKTFREETPEEEAPASDSESDGSASEVDDEEADLGEDSDEEGEPSTAILETAGDLNSVRALIADICTCVTANPDRSLRRERSTSEYGDTVYTIYDLLAFLKHENAQVVELAMLSLFVLFKDIVPGYRIRSKAEDATATKKKEEAEDASKSNTLRHKNGKVMLKKTTKQLKDAEHHLLSSYQMYLKALDTRIAAGLGGFRRQMHFPGLTAMAPGGASRSYSPEYTAHYQNQQLALVAVRCQCELLKAVSHFNFRSILLMAVVSRAAGVSPEALQPVDVAGTRDQGRKGRTSADAVVHNNNAAVARQLLDLCCATLTHLFQRDVDGEISYEIVCMVAKTLVEVKYLATEQLVRCLEYVKLSVHQDESKQVHRQSKQDRRKRRKFDEDDVEAGLLEADTTRALATSKLKSKRFQADALHEICLLYFRVVKQKVGVELLPVTLEGLGRITHLVNIDTIHDLVDVLKALLDSNTLLSSQSEERWAVVRVSCVHCALNTLLSPGGAELQIDETVFTKSLLGLCLDLPAGFDRWDLVFQCVEMTLMRRRETSGETIDAFVKVLILSSVHVSLQAPARELMVEGAVRNTNWVYTSKSKKNRKPQGGGAAGVGGGGEGAGGSSGGGKGPVGSRATGAAALSAEYGLADGGLYALTLAHNVLLRYPKNRKEFVDWLRAAPIKPQADSSSTVVVRGKGKKGKGRAPVFAEEDDDGMVCDLAMTALRRDPGAAGKGGAGARQGLDHLQEHMGVRQVVWVLGMLRAHVDPRYKHVVHALTSRDVIPLALKSL
jgi:uncharacterized membrane protein YgcG